MTIKRMLVLLSAMAALFAVSAPAAQASPPYWTDGSGETLGGEEEAIGFAGEGEIAWVSAGTGLVSGPCEINGSGELWNSETMGEGEISEFNFETPCSTNVPTCSVSNATNNASAETPWPVTLLTTDTVAIGSAEDPMTFTTHYSGAGCALAGIPPTMGITGIITATVENGPEETVCIDFNNHVDDLHIYFPAALGPVDLVNPTGEPFCIEALDENGLTFEH